MNVLLNPDLEKFVADKVKSGQFSDASALVNIAVELLRDQEQLSPDHEQFLKSQVKLGVDQLDRGERAEFTAQSIISQERQRLGKR